MFSEPENLPGVDELEYTKVISSPVTNVLVPVALVVVFVEVGLTADNPVTFAALILIAMVVLPLANLCVNELMVPG